MSKNVLIISVASLTKAMAADDADFKALLTQALEYAAGMEVKILSIDDLQNKLTAAENALLLANTRLGEYDGPEGIVTILRNELAEAQGDRDNAFSEIALLSEKLDMQEKVKSHDGILVTIHEEHFMLIGKKFLIKGRDLTADELSKDQELLEWMHERKSGSLIPADELTDGITEE